MNPFFEGVILGFTLAMLLGPALFTLLQTSIHRGVKSGFFLALGIFMSDITIVIFTYLGAVQLLSNERNYILAGISGGIILILFGMYTFVRKVHIDENNNLIEAKKVPGLMTYILKGFFLNIMNPFVWFFWISVMVGIGSNYGADKPAVTSFFMGTLFTIFGTDVLKVVIANKIKHYLNPKLLILINRIVGILLAIFGIFLILRVIFKF
jgi:threonine/homoserine/homoserine lactone efflux protein